MVVAQMRGEGEAQFLTLSILISIFPPFNIVNNVNLMRTNRNTFHQNCKMAAGERPVSNISVRVSLPEIPIRQSF